MSEDREVTGDGGAFLARMVQSVRERLLAARDAGPGYVAAPLVLQAPNPDGPVPGLLGLAAAFELTDFETAILALCAAFELDTGIGWLCGPSDGERGAPSFALALTSFGGGSWDAFASDQPLRAWRLIELDGTPGQPLICAAMRCSERVIDHIKGLDCLDARLVPLIEPAARHDAAVQEGAAAQAGKLAALWSGTGGPTAMLTGGTAASRTSLAARAAAACGRRLYRFSADAAGGTPVEIDLLVRLWQRENALAPLALVIDLMDGEPSMPGGHAAVLRFVGRLACPAAVSTDQGSATFAAALLTIEVMRPSRMEQEAAWTAGLGNAALAADLAADFNLDLGAIRRIAAAQPLRATEAPAAGQLWEDCRAIARPTLEALAERVTVRASWGQIALPADQQRRLRQIIGQMRQRRQVHEHWGFSARGGRGLGITALFAGESGTGKTMAAEIVSQALGLDLYRVDLSAMVSKYIGESEKNLRKIFDAAEQGGVALLFDEADALFGKRSEVKDSHDRFANVGVSYLLQRLESFSGLAILTTNMKAALDTAFLRRLRFVVQFPYPSQAERALLWRGAFPAGVPLATLDHDRLSRLNLTGGNIATAALNAAFLAADEGSSVGMHHVLRAARDEMLKLDRVMNEADYVLADMPPMPRAAE